MEGDLVADMSEHGCDTWVMTKVPTLTRSDEPLPQRDNRTALDVVPRRWYLGRTTTR